MRSVLLPERFGGTPPCTFGTLARFSGDSSIVGFLQFRQLLWVYRYTLPYFLLRVNTFFKKCEKISFPLKNKKCDPLKVAFFIVACGILSGGLGGFSVSLGTAFLGARGKGRPTVHSHTLKRTENTVAKAMAFTLKVVKQGIHGGALGIAVRRAGILKDRQGIRPGKDLDVSLICSEAGISRSHLHRKMKEMTGLTVHDCIQNIRMEQAARLLTEQKLNITQVAYTVGYSSQPSFSAVFRKHFGVSPTEYISQH